MAEFDQSMLPEEERLEIFENILKYFLLDKISKTSEGLIRCGSGRWAQLVSPLVENFIVLIPAYRWKVKKFK